MVDICVCVCDMDKGTLNELNVETNRIFEDLVEEIILDIAIEQHRDHTLIHANRTRGRQDSKPELDNDYRKETKIDSVVKKEFEIRENRGGETVTLVFFI